MVLSGDNNPVSVALGITSPSPVPQFAFKDTTSGFQPTVAKADKDKQMHAAKRITPAVQTAVSQLIQTGYVDPNTWGDSAAIADLFTDAAKGQIEPNVDTLTLGADASETYESLDPTPGRLKVVALTDGKSNATRAMAEYRFNGKAILKDGTVAKIAVNGTLFLVPDGDTWKIEAFDVNREVKPVTPKTSASAPSSPSESA